MKLFFFSVLPSVKPSVGLVGAPVESHVLLQCIVEAFPKPLNTWFRGEGIVQFFFVSPHHLRLPPSRAAMMPKKFSHFFNLPKWLELLLFLSIFHLIQFLPPPPTICHDCLRSIQTRSCIMARNISLRSRWLIRLHGKWIWRWKIFTRMTLHLTSAGVRMLWEKVMLASDYKVKEWNLFHAIAF